MNGEQGEGYLSSNSLTSWPFNPGEPPQEVARLFSDAYVCLPPCRRFLSVDVIDIRVDEIFMYFTVVVSEESDDRPEPVVTRLGPIYVDRMGAPKYEVVSFKNSNIVVKFVIDGWHLADSEQFYKEGPFPLCESCISYSSSRVMTVSIYNSENGEYPTRTGPMMSGDVKLYGGYNVKVYTNGSIDNGVTIDALPGYGDGVVPCDCDEGGNPDECDTGKKEKGNVKPDPYGDVVLSSDKCIAVVPYRGPGIVSLHGRCTTPCTVDMYMDEAGDLSKLADDVSDDKNKLVDVANRYNALACSFDEDVCSRVILSGVLSQPNFGEGTNDLTESAISGYLDRVTGRVVIANTSTKKIVAKIEDYYAKNVKEDRFLLYKGGFLAKPKDSEMDGGVSRKMLNTENVKDPFPIPSGASVDITFLFVDPILLQLHTEDLQVESVVTFLFTWDTGSCIKKCEMHLNDGDDDDIHDDDE